MQVDNPIDSPGDAITIDSIPFPVDVVSLGEVLAFAGITAVMIVIALKLGFRIVYLLWTRSSGSV